MTYLKNILMLLILSWWFHKAVIPFRLRTAGGFLLEMRLQGSAAKRKERIRYDNTIAMVRAMERYPIHTITHPGAKIDIDTRILAKHAAKHNVLKLTAVMDL